SSVRRCDGARARGARASDSKEFGVTGERRSCAGVRKRDGAPCQATVVLEDGFCPAHSPAAGVDMAELGRNGGLEGGVVRRETALSFRARLAARLEERADEVIDRLLAAGERDWRADIAVLHEAHGPPVGAAPEVAAVEVALREAAGVLEARLSAIVARRAG